MNTTLAYSPSGDTQIFFLSNGKTPNGESAYLLALDNGFVGSVDDFLASLKGKDAYLTALDNGFVGTYDDWVASWSLPSPSQSDQYKILQTDGINKFWVDLENLEVSEGVTFFQSLSTRFLEIGKVNDIIPPIINEIFMNNPPSIDYGTIEE